MDSTQIYEQWRQAAVKEGQQKGTANIVLRVLPQRIGALSNALQETIRGIALPELEDLAEALLDFKSMDDLLAWLAVNHIDGSPMYDLRTKH